MIAAGSFRSVMRGILISTLIFCIAIPGFAAGSREKAAGTSEKPKYIFLFIGDGMSFPQVQLASYFLGKDAADTVSVLQNSSRGADSPRAEPLSFMKFPIVGSINTYDSSSFVPDSASTATALLSGSRTHQGVINMDISKTRPYTTIAEQLRDRGRKIGVITTVNLNHATPAATYAHQPSRRNNYAIGLELVQSNFDYFAGGALMDPQDKNGDQKSIYDVARDQGYQVIMTQAEATALSRQSAKKAIIVAETLADSGAMSYELDRKEGEWALKDYVRKGIEFLDGDQGFFMMIEGGKIDWACHANDAGSSIHDTLALSDAVQEAIAFYEKHPSETLILVTGDHETGGMSLGYAGTGHNMFLDLFESQKISQTKFDTDYVEAYKVNRPSFETVLADIENLFGLVPETAASRAKSPLLVLSSAELERIRTAYERSLSSGTSLTAEERLAYGSYEPLAVTLTHILSNKAGVNFSTYDHSGITLPVFAMGAGQTLFSGYYDNTEVYHKLAELTLK